MPLCCSTAFTFPVITCATIVSIQTVENGGTRTTSCRSPTFPLFLFYSILFFRPRFLPLFPCARLTIVSEGWPATPSFSLILFFSFTLLRPLFSPLSLSSFYNSLGRWPTTIVQGTITGFIRGIQNSYVVLQSLLRSINIYIKERFWWEREL